MGDNNYHIKLNFCQLTLDELKCPFIHVDKGCQFNQSKPIQPLNQCPVCRDVKNNENKDKKCDNIEQDEHLIIQIEQKNERQIVYNKKQKTHYFMKRRHFTEDNISKIQEVKDLQKIFYQKLRQKSITIQQILAINQERNQQFIYCLKNLSEPQRIPILMAVINNKLVLFYHLYKLKVDLILFDVTNPKIRQKVGDNTHGTLQQIMFYENNIYFLYLKQNVSTLFAGEFSQIFTLQNNQDALFQIKQYSYCKLDGPSKLILIQEKDIDKDFVMLGNGSYYSLKQNQIQNCQHPLSFLTKNTLCHNFNNKQLLMINQEENKEKNNNNISYLCYDLSKPNYIQDPKNTREETFSQYQKFDNYLNFGDQMVLFNTQDLKNEKCQILSFSSWLPNSQRTPPMSLSISVINHQSYMQPIKVISTQKGMNNINCQLIGIRLAKKDIQQQDNEPDVFPALLVYNGQSQSFEVELI